MLQEWPFLRILKLLQVPYPSNRWVVEVEGKSPLGLVLAAERANVVSNKSVRMRCVKWVALGRRPGFEGFESAHEVSCRCQPRVYSAGAADGRLSSV